MTLVGRVLRFLPVAALLVLGANLAPATATANPNQDSARGRVNQATFTVVFDAQSNATGFDASGRVRFTNRSTDPNQVFSGEVTCLRVIAATATTPLTAVIGGVITDAPPGSPVASFIITATDQGKFATAADTFGFSLSTAPPPPDGGCSLPSFTSPVADGNVIIENALP